MPTVMLCPQDALPRPLISHIARLAQDSAAPLPASFFEPPSSTLASKAIEYVESTLPLWAVNHSFRTYAFALSVAHYAGWDKGEAAARLGFDREAIFLACFLHEIGFEQHKRPTTRLSIEFWSAIKAREWILSQGPSDPGSADSLAGYADDAFEAIALHTIEPTMSSGRARLVPALCALGANQDLLGGLTAFIHKDTVENIISRWPRNGYIDGLADVALTEVSRKPGCLFEACLDDFIKPMYLVACFMGKQGVLDHDKRDLDGDGDVGVDLTR